MLGGDTGDSLGGTEIGGGRDTVGGVVGAVGGGGDTVGGVVGVVAGGGASVGGPTAGEGDVAGVTVFGGEAGVGVGALGAGAAAGEGGDWVGAGPGAWARTVVAPRAKRNKHMKVEEAIVESRKQRERKRELFCIMMRSNQS